MTITVKCPTCGRPVEWCEASKYRPFCSERCKIIDLGAWANDEYKIVKKLEEADDDFPADFIPPAYTKKSS
jgi:endogenous inhibitor of DNA gyrase (YacG/DUF329 family)